MKVIKWQYAALTIIFFLIHACLTFSFHYTAMELFSFLFGVTFIKKKSS